MKSKFYFEAFGQEGVPPYRVYSILKELIQFTKNDLEDIERCYRVDTPDKTCYIYSMEELQNLLYAYENAVSIKIDTQNIWYQMCQRMKAEVQK